MSAPFAVEPVVQPVSATVEVRMSDGSVRRITLHPAGKLYVALAMANRPNPDLRMPRDIASQVFSTEANHVRLDLVGSTVWPGDGQLLEMTFSQDDAVDIERWNQATPPDFPDKDEPASQRVFL